MSEKQKDQSTLVAWLATPICLGVGIAFVFAISGLGASEVKLASAIWPVVLAFLIQWLAFVPSYLMRTEKFYDLVGGLTFISVSILALALAPERGPKELVLFTFVVIWASRLSLFLFLRIHRAKSDRRFAEIKQSFPKFLFAWTAQGLWVTFTLAPIMAVMASDRPVTLGAFFWLGVSFWLFGFVFEVVADLQKSRFKENPENKGAFIRNGLWSISRHPNYFGEIVLWVGVSIAAFPALTGFQYLCLTSAGFIFILLRFISGVPMLEKSAEERWGEQEAYRRYKVQTPILFPRLPIR